MRAFDYRARKSLTRRRDRAANRYLAARHECPCCGWTGHRFLSYLQPSRKASLSNEECPQCGSHRRHRGFAMWLQSAYGLASRRGTAILVAPEASLRRLWDDAPAVRTIALDARRHRAIDVQADLRCLPLDTGSIDIIWCHHVLEHIEDDRPAMAELARVLKVDGGELLFSVPMRRGATTEYGFADPRDNGHWRLYGCDDLEAMMRDVGLRFEFVEHAIDPALVRRYHTGRIKLYRCTRAQ